MNPFFKSLLLVCLLATSWMNAQETCKLSGMVLDSLNLPVYDASITAFDSQNNGVGYTFSDTEGQFKLELPCGKDYELEIEHIEFRSKVHAVTLDKSKREKIVLSRETITLKDVVAQGRVPIKIKGDTIEYDAESFKTGNEENLEDILKKLPGIQVENGKVFYQGKEINSIKVEGREIFGGNTKLLTKNLPSDAVDKIQLNKKFKANPFANSLQDEEQPELNIVLKEDKKSLIFGNMTVGGDADEHYDLQEKLFYFSPHTDATLISDFNTYGKEVFDSEDYFQFLGGISELSEEGGTLALRNSMSSIFFGSGQNATQMQNHLGALHFGYEPNDKLYVSGFGMLTDNSLRYRSSQQRIYDDFTLTDESTNQRDLMALITRLRLDYRINDKSQLKYRVNGNLQDNTNQQNIQSFLDDNTQALGFRDELSDRQNVNLSQRLSYIAKVGSDDNFGIYLSHQYQKETPDWLLNASQDNNSLLPFQGIFNLTPQNDLFNVQQDQTLNSHTLQGLAIYNHLITNLSNIRIKLGANYNTQSFENQIASFGAPITDDFSQTESDFSYGELYADATYTRKFGDLKVDIGAGIHQFDFENQNNVEDTSNNFTRILPHFTANYEFSSGKWLTFSYDKSVQIPQVKELTNTYTIQNYFSLYRGNPALSETTFHNFNLRYGLHNYFKFFSLYAGISYNRRENNIRSATSFVAVNQINSPINTPTPEESWSFNLYTSKRFTKWYSLKLSGNTLFSTFTTFQNFLTDGSDFTHTFGNQSQNPSESLAHTYTLTQTLKVKKKLEVDLGFTYNNNYFQTNTLQNRFIDYIPFTEAAWVISDKLLLETRYQFQSQYSNGELLNENQDLSASLRFKPTKKVYIKLIAGNLLNNNTIVSNSFNDNFIQINRQEVLGRYILATVKYKF